MTTESTPQTALAVRELPEPVARRGITEPQWLTLANNLYPGANPKSVLMVWDYCAARKLDPMKKPVHIVQMDIKVGDGWEKRDVVLPGIYEYRTTAHRTGDYLGHDKPTYGPVVKFAGVEAPEWCEFTVYRWNTKAAMKVPYTVVVSFREVVATKRDGNANQRWARAPQQMLTKCAEAAALREAFPEEIGGEPTADEMDGHAIDVTPERVPSAFERLPEALRDRIEVAFSTLKLTAAQRLARTNEFLGPDVVPEDGAERLLVWAREEFKKQAEPKPKPANNNKPQRQQPAEPKPEPLKDSAPAVQDAEIVETTAPKAEEIQWGNQGVKAPEGEMF